MMLIMFVCVINNLMVATAHIIITSSLIFAARATTNSIHKNYLKWVGVYRTPYTKILACVYIENKFSFKFDSVIKL